MTSPRFVILAAIDETPGAAAVVSSASALAQSTAGSELHLLYVAPLEPTRFREVVAMDAHGEYLDWRVREAHRLSKGVVVGHLREGDAAATIVQTAASIDADLVIVSTHDRRGLARWTLGSVAQKVMERAACPVLVVRKKDHHAFHAPEIEPPCLQCVATQRETRGAALWCARHAEHHPRGHLHYEGSESSALGGDPLAAR